MDFNFIIKLNNLIEFVTVGNHVVSERLNSNEVSNESLVSNYDLLR
jgi:hypothetical protein